MMAPNERIIQNTGLEYKMNGHNIDVITSVSAPANTKFYNTPEMVNWVKSYQKRQTNQTRFQTEQKYAVRKQHLYLCYQPR